MRVVSRLCGAWLLATMALAAAVAVVLAGAPPDLQLALAPDHVTLVAREPLEVTGSITNHGTSPVVLVLPGDGSEVGWRTPILTWRVGRVTAEGRVLPVPGRPIARCGNVNALEPEEVFELGPGETRDLGPWLGPPPFDTPGRYTIDLRYANRPDHRWYGMPLGDHDAGAMERVKTSTRCTVQSNVLAIEVKARDASPAEQR